MKTSKKWTIIFISMIVIIASMLIIDISHVHSWEIIEKALMIIKS